LVFPGRPGTSDRRERDRGFGKRGIAGGVTFTLGVPQMMSLLGHLAYGLLLGLTHRALTAAEVPAAKRVRA
jgi:hypothetical protein